MSVRGLRAGVRRRPVTIHAAPAISITRTRQWPWMLVFFASSKPRIYHCKPHGAGSKTMLASSHRCVDQMQPNGREQRQQMPTRHCLGQPIRAMHATRESSSPFHPCTRMTYLSAQKRFPGERHEHAEVPSQARTCKLLASSLLARFLPLAHASVSSHEAGLL